MESIPRRTACVLLTRGVMPRPLLDGGRETRAHERSGMPERRRSSLMIISNSWGSRWLALTCALAVGTREATKRRQPERRT